MTKKKFLVLAGSMCLILVLASLPFTVGCVPEAPPEGEQIVWRWHTQDAPTHPSTTMVLQPFADEVFEKTNGRLKIDVYPASALGYKGSEMLRILQAGTIEAGQVLSCWCLGDWFDMGVMDLPLLFKDSHELYDACMLTLPLWQEEFAKQWDIQVIGFINEGEQIPSSRKKLTEFSDFKGQKIRTFYPMLAEMVEGLGASPANVAFGEMYSALQRGVVDGVITGAMTQVAIKVWEVSEYFMTGGGIGGYALNFNCVSKKAWDELPPDVQEIVLELGLKYSKVSRDVAEEKAVEAYKTLEANGMTWTKVSAEDLAWARSIAADKVWPAWQSKAGPLGKEVLATILESRK